jgi:hypothetical protein
MGQAVLQSSLRSWKILRRDSRDRHVARRHPDALRQRALEESISRADELASAGEDNGVAVWRRISDAVGQLVNTIPPGAVH